MDETRLSAEIRKRGLKKGWVAEQAGVSRSAMAMIVNGKSDPTLRTARKIAKVLGVTIEELWPDEEDE